MNTLISIIIPCFNEEKYIAQCLDSVIESNYSKESMEVFVVDGQSSDKTIEIIKQYTERYSYVKLLYNPDRIVPKAMNLAINKASGDYIIRLDAHSKFPKDYFSKLVKYSKELKADNVGGIVITEVKNSNKKSNSIKEVLSHKLGVGNSSFRLGVNKIKEVDTVPFGCYKKEVFSKYGCYDERLIRNQDIELNKRIVNGGGKVYLVPDVKCTYYARESLWELAKNNYANGYWNILTAYYTGTFKSLSLRHFIPLLFLLSLLLPVAVSLCFFSAIWVSLLSLASYLSLVIIISFKLKNKSNGLIYLMLSFLVLHISYGMGSLNGVFWVLDKLIRGRK